MKKMIATLADGRDFGVGFDGAEGHQVEKHNYGPNPRDFAGFNTKHIMGGLRKRAAINDRHILGGLRKRKTLNHKHIFGGLKRAFNDGHILGGL